MGARVWDETRDRGSGLRWDQGWGLGSGMGPGIGAQVWDGTWDRARV